jgi:maleylacetate reductase
VRTKFEMDFQLTVGAVELHAGPGVRRNLPSILSAQRFRKAMVLSTPEQSHCALELAELLGPAAAAVYTRAVMHTPVEITEDALSHLEESGADCLVAVGGGSTIGLSKALALRTGRPQIVLPTTYAGSEATPLLGQTEGGQKTTISDPAVRPAIILYDSELLASLPAALTVTSAFNAMAHAVEALYAQGRNPHTSLLATEGLRIFAQVLPRVLAEPGNLSARGQTQYAGWLCGTVLGQVGMALHHKLCHVLGGACDLPHAETHTVLLPHVIGYNASAVADALSPLTDIFGGGNPASAIAKFSQRLGAPRSLRELGMAEADIDHAADLATRAPYWNPRPVTRDSIRTLLEEAWSGVLPGDERLAAYSAAGAETQRV